MEKDETNKTKSEHIPGVCNIGPAERRARRMVGFGGMSRSIWYKSPSILITAFLLSIFVSCLEQPVSPYQASNAKIYLTVKSSMLQKIIGQYVDSLGDSIIIGVTTNLPEFVDSIGIKLCSGTGIIEGWTVLKNISTSQITDTMWYKMLLKNEGENSVIAQAYIQQNNSYCDTIQINVVNMSAPVITANPMNQAVCLGSPDSFSVNAAGPGMLTYQWKNTSGNLTGAHYKGTGTNKLIIDTILITDTGTYVCVVTNAMDSSVSSSGARLTINTYTVKFNGNGGSPVDSQEIFCNSTAIAPPTPNKAGYNFSGWYSDSLLTSAFNFSTPITAAITLFARWTINSNIISFNSNGGSSVSNQAVVYNFTATLPTPAPTKVGYSLAGWYSDSLLMNPFSFSTPITGAITLYAKWILNTYTVSFISNGGSAVASQTIAYNSMAIQPTPSPTKTGYIFSGWYSDSLLTTVFNFSTPITATITLYAKWTTNAFTVSFNSEGGSVVGTQAVAYNTTAAQPTPAPTKMGYAFSGWYSDSLLTTAFNFSTPIMATIMLYAKWTTNTFTVSFNSEGGSVVGTQTVAYNTTAAQPTPAPTKMGYTFSGWYSDSLLTTAFNFSTPIMATITLYAKWTTNAFTVSFNSEGGSVVGTQTVAYNTTATLPSPAPTKMGYTFSGWYSDSLLTTAFNFSTPIMATITLYAKWTTNAFTVSFNSEGGSVVGTQTVAYNTTATLPSPAPTKMGYTFSGWYSDSLLTTAFNFSTPIMATITLYAKWTTNAFTVSFNSEGGSVVGTQTVAYNTTATLPSPAPTKMGYTFSGWYSDSLLTTAFNFSTPIMATITLYAKWTTNAFTVSFNSEGGSVVGTQTVAYNTTATLPSPAPTKSGAIFIKWYSDSIFTMPFNFSTPITAQTTLYAKWASLYDIDGNFYDTITIGTQMWMVENLKTTRYNDGSAIPLVTDNTAWSNLTTSGYCYYNDSATYGTTYGALYNGYSVNTKKLAPIGWHVPTDSEWTVLITLYGGTDLAGGPLKATGITYWTSPNTGATNQSGFSALPGGFRDGNGTFEGSGGYGSWWSATAFSATGLWSREVNSSGTNVVRGNSFVGYGFSVRCIRDN